jgi:DNA-binding transcriptional MerR regulator
VSFTVAFVARRLGVAPATLRTWERRYGLTPSGRSQGGHRRYSDQDLARLNVMKRLLLSGVTPAQAAASALGVDPQDTCAVDECCQVSGDAKSTARAMSRSLYRAAVALDADAAASVVADAINRRGVIWTWDQVIVPVLREVGEQWAKTGEGIEVEHVLSEVIASQCAQVVAKYRLRKDVPNVLLACAPDDLHCLPLRAIAAALAETYVSTQMLGPRTPIHAVANAAERLGSPVILLWAQIPEAASRVDWSAWNQSAGTGNGATAPALVLAGPGWGEPRPNRAHRVHDLTETVTTIRNAIAA